MEPKYYGRLRRELMHDSKSSGIIRTEYGHNGFNRLVKNVYVDPSKCDMTYKELLDTVHSEQKHNGEEIKLYGIYNSKTEKLLKDEDLKYHYEENFLEKADKFVSGSSTTYHAIKSWERDKRRQQKK